MRARSGWHEMEWLGYRYRLTMIRLLLRLLLVAIVAYLVIALLQALFLELLLDGQVAPDASIAIQLGGIVGTMISGVVGGYLAARLGGERPWLHGLVVLAPLLLDTIFVITRSDAGHPLWFNLAGSGTLMAATAFGCWLVVRGTGLREESDPAPAG